MSNQLGDTMKSLLIIAAISLLTVSCGRKREYYTTVQENNYDDSQVKGEQILQSARIAALEARIAAFETNFDTVVIDYNDKINNLETDAQDLRETLDYNVAVVTAMLADLNTKQLTPVKICASAEYLIQTSSGFYAVYMVSNNFGTYLGKLAEETQYQSTDIVKANFKIVNNQVVCL